jgi:putative transposase
VDGSRVSLPKLPGIRFHQYRPLRGSILTVTVKRDRAGTWWVSFACDLGAAPAKVEPVTYVGIDVGLHTLATLSDPTAAPVENPKHGRRSAAQLARLQRTEKRRKRGSRSHRRAQIQVAKCYRRQANQRRDTAWKAAKSLVSQYDVVVHERLTIAKMVHGKLAKSIYDAGWGLLLRAIACKAEEAGKWCVAVDPRGTSQECSRCGATVAKGLSVRIHRCPWCGFVACRDANAAVNIEARGRRAVTDARACSLAEARRAA